ncbi:hypothetical protein QLQ12_44715 [Actinoplanes sp. NEAU-A12]|uniref:ATP-binding protein n=1 Tax=Actinoplanes sandaracinus TaxID=3045177 RepID=A0ABT6X117_9ACTN|nr:hypothetical protein [Actinoplanes sandaracinus]MDI6105706.1 hypothetical protein [Actinoplanes sandaracinus]
MLQGQRTPQKPVLESFLDALNAPPTERAEIMKTWERLTDESREWQAGLVRVTEVSPRELGVNATIRPLPGYVPRLFDPDLRQRIEDGTRRGCFIVLIGGSSTGKTRSLYEAVRAEAGQWWLAQPADTRDIYRLLDEPDRPAVVWLDEIARFFDQTPALTKPQVARMVRAGHIVVGTLWFEDYSARMDSRVTGAVERELLLFAEKIDVPRYFRPEEQLSARRLAATDSAIRAALDAPDDGLTQVLAAGPELMRRWEHAPPYARAAITAAADARRLGILSPLPSDLLLEAMSGYLSRPEQAASQQKWLMEVTSYAAQPINETSLAALPREAGERPGTPPGYRAADFLAQQLRAQHRAQCPPESLWTALIDRLDSRDEIRRLSDAAAARMRYRLQARALRRLMTLGDGGACIELALLLVRRDDLEAAESVLVEGVRGQRDTRTATALVEVMTLRERAEPLRTTDRTAANARRLLWDLLYDRGESLDLRTKDGRGDLTAGDDLATLLAERGELTELRERANAGHRLAADLLAEMLATLRRSTELAARAKEGDQAAATWLDQQTDAETAEPAAEIARLRADLAAGAASAADRLTSLLFELGDEAALRAEVDAGTPHAVDRLLALLMAGCGDDATAAEEVRRLRAFGMHCDGTPALTEGNDHG